MRLGSVLAALALAGAPRQGLAANPNRLLTGYALTSWTDADGIPLGVVYAIAQDRQDYLWIGSDAGLFRFDGLRFTPWDALSDSPLPASPVSALSAGEDGSICAGFQSGDVLKLLNGHIEHVAPSAGPIGAVTDIVHDRSGTIWIIGGGRVYRLHDRTWDPIAIVSPGRDTTAQHLDVGPSGTVWIASRAGVFKQRDARSNFAQVTSGFTWAVDETANGIVWTTDIVGGFRRLGEPPLPRRALEGSGYRLLHDRLGNLWIATLDEGLWLARHPSDASPDLEQAALRTGLSSDSVQSLLEDREGNVWVGTTGGLHRLTRRALTPVESLGFVVDIVPGDAGSVTAGTTDGLMTLARSTDGWHRVQGASGGPDVRTLYRDAGEALWIGMNFGVMRFADGRFTRVALPPHAPVPATVITRARGGGVWIGDGTSLVRWDGGRVTPFAAPPDVPVERITMARADEAGRLWLGLDHGRLAMLDARGALHVFDARDGLAPGTHSVIDTVLVDRRGVVWIGGTGGLTRFADGRFRTVGRNSGLPSSRVWSIVEDDQDYLWLSVDRGLVRLRRDEVDKAIDHADYHVQYELYDTSDGLAGASLGAIRSMRGPDGRLWFVRGGGLTVVDPRGIAAGTKSTRVPLRIEAVLANERRLTPDAAQTLPAGTKRLSISYTAVTLGSANKIRFRYRLDGFDPAWVDAGTRRQAFYTNLSPRRYRFRVEAAREDGVWAASTADWGFAIEPAFYEAGWFFGLCAIGVLLAAWALWRTRLNIVQRQFALVLGERTRLSREIHDTLLQSLVGVTLQLEGIANTVESSATSAREEIKRVRREVEAYIREARQSIWDLRSTVLETADLPTALRDFGRRVTAGTPIRFATSVVGQTRRPPAKIENELLRIGQEAITNAVRHAHATRIDVLITFGDRAVTLRVTDDGRGFGHEVEDADRRHYGLMTMKERAESLGGHLDVFTDLGRGTNIETVVPA